MSKAMVLLLCGLLAESTGPRDGADSELHRELIKSMRAAIPERGAVHAHVLNTADGSRRLVGFDYATGAYYVASSGHVSGSDTRGGSFSGAPGSGLTADQRSSGLVTGRHAIEAVVPGVIAWEFVHDSGLMTELWRETDGYRVKRTSENGQRYPRSLPPGFTAPVRTMVYHVSKAGRVTRVECLDNPVLSKAFDYSDEAAARYGVVRADGGGTRRVLDLRLEPSATPGDFEASAVERLALAADLSSALPGSARRTNAAGSAAVGSEATTTSPERAAGVLAAPDVSLSRAAWRWWAAGGGVAIIALALWLKRRTA